jgi:osmotically-inducible protein OsmY
MARYEEERYGGQRGSTRRGGGGYNDRGRDDDLEQQERDRYRSSEYGRDYGETERYGGGGARNEGSWRNRERDSGSSLGSRGYEGYDEEENSGSYNAGSRETNRYGGQYGNQGRSGGQRYRQGMRDYNPSQGFGFPQEDQGSQQFGPGSQGYSSYGHYGPQSYGQTSQGYGQSSQGYGRGYDEGTQRGQSSWRGQSSQGNQRYYQGGRNAGGMQADGWSAEPDEMRWGRQQGLYGSSEYGGYISSQRSQSDYQSHAGKGPKGWQRSDDRIREEVNEVLARHPEIDASEIEVRVQNGEVTLTGTVDERRDKRMAEDIVERVFGVKDVENKIKVKGGLFGFGSRDKDVTNKPEKETENQEASRRTTAGSTSGTTAGTTTR